MLRTVWPAREIPTRIASSKLVSERAVISVTRATVPAMPSSDRPWPALAAGRSFEDRPER
jgi:hypothetical protein